MATFTITSSNIISAGGGWTSIGGGSYEIVSNGPSNPSTGTLIWSISTADTLTGSGFGTVTVGTAPTGFQPTTSLSVSIGGTPTGTNNTITYTGGGTSGSSSPLSPSNNTSFINLYIPYVEIAATVRWDGSENGEIIAKTVTITGNYVIATWYFNPTTNHYMLSQSNPGSPWVAQNPTPAISSIFPSQGPSSGGTSIALSGSGFGDGALVRLGTAPATSISVANSNLVTCTSGAYLGNLSGPTNLTIDGEDPTHSGITVTVDDASTTAMLVNVDGGITTF